MWWHCCGSTRSYCKRKSSSSLSRFLPSLSSDSNGGNEGADSDDEEILKLDDLQAPESLKVKSYGEASSELNHASDFLLHKVNQIWLMSYARLFQKLSLCISKND